MRKVEVLEKRVEAVEGLLPPPNALSSLVSRMGLELRESLLELLKAEDLQEAFQGLDEKQKKAVKDLYKRRDKDAVMIRVYLGSLNHKLRRILKT